MKKLSLIALLIIYGIILNAQDVEKKDTTKISIGKSTILIISPNAEDVEIITKEKEDEKFKGHWGGIDLGINTYLNADNTTSLPLSDHYLDINTGKSWGVGINLIEKNIGIHKQNIGLVTGLGLDINNYRFNKDFILMSDSSRLYAIESNLQFEKNKLVVTYLTVPLLLEFQFPVGKKDNVLYFSAGGIGGLRIGSHTKYVYDFQGLNKDKNKEDYHLSPFKYGLTFRVGYNGLNLFANYNLSELFETNEGPELYPVCVGISFSIF